jgi:hypothetical protein
MSGQLQFSYGLVKAATLSACGRYRYNLLRTWDIARPAVCWVMLNPSTADADRDDNTIRKVTKYARTWGHGGIVVVNLFALRSTDPAELYKTGAAAVGPENDGCILTAARGAGLVMAAWGNHGAYRARQAEVVTALRVAGVRLHHLGLTKDGHPRHPLYLADDLEPEPWT